jgi:AAHS family 4-hydroxybenzoate transporter-like MFS transporter
LSFATGNPLIGVVMTVVSNFFVDGSFAGTQALVASSYPSEIRGTTTGWVTGIGRLIGGGAGTAAGGYLFAAGWTSAGLSALLASIMGVGAVAILALILVSRGRLPALPAPRVEPAGS